MSDPLQIKAASATSAPSAVRTVPRLAKLIDTTTCIGCKACEVACQEWNDLGIEPTSNFGSYQTLPDLTVGFWNLIRFAEVTRDDRFAWLMRKDQCMHCETAGCLEACPVPGAIVQYENGIVDIVQDKCIGCGYCIPACPFDIPRLSPRSGRAHKCTMCSDRVEVGLEPACVKSCPTQCLSFGTYDDMHAAAEERVAQLKRDGREQAGIYGDDLPGIGGHAHVLTVLDRADHPEDYGLPPAPAVASALVFRDALAKPLGWVLLGASALLTGLHWLAVGPDGEEP